MPWVEVTTREPLAQDTKASLARALATTVTEIEVSSATEAARYVDWMWFRVLPADDWAVGGEFSEAHVRGRTMCFAHIITPEAFLNRELQLKVISEVALKLREALTTAPDDDGSGIWVILTEIPQGKWWAGGRPMPLSQLIDVMDGDVSRARRVEMQAHFDGYDKMKDTFEIPR